MAPEKDEAVIFDESHLLRLETKLLEKRNECDVLKALQKRAEAEFKKIQTEYIKVQKEIKDAAIPA